MQHSFAVMYERVHHVTGVDIPHAHRRVTGTADDHLVVVLQAKNRTGVTGEDLQRRKNELMNSPTNPYGVTNLAALERVAVPDFDGVVPQAGHDLVVVVLQTVNALRVLRPAVYPLQVVISRAPVVLDRFDVLHDLGEQLAVELVRSMRHARSRYEQVFDPGNKRVPKVKNPLFVHLLSHTNHPFRSASPRHSESVRTFRSISFFHSMPSDMTRLHSLQTRSARHSDFASR